MLEKQNNETTNKTYIQNNLEVVSITTVKYMSLNIQE